MSGYHNRRRRSHDSPDRSSPGADPMQWRNTNPNQHQSPHRQFAHNQPPMRPPPHPFGGPQIPPNMGHQRMFTPRSSYFGAGNTGPQIPPAPTVGQHYNTGAYYESPEHPSTPPPPPMRANPPVPYAMAADTSRAVYTHPSAARTPEPSGSTASDIFNTIDIENIDQIREAVINANRQTATGLVLQESTVTETDPTDTGGDRMAELIAESRKISNESEVLTRSRKDTESRIQELDKELKAFEQKIRLRDQLKRTKDQFEEKIEALGRDSKRLLDEMADLNRRIRSESTTSAESEASVIREVSDEQRPARVDRPGPPQPAAARAQSSHSSHKPTSSGSTSSLVSALKRPKSSSAQQTAVKKLRIADHMSPKPPALKPSTPSSGGPKRTAHIAFRGSTSSPQTRSPLTRTPLTRTPLTRTDSPKISRLCRQPPPGPQRLGSSAVTSGVKTSKPLRPGTGGSRNRRLDDDMPAQQTASAAEPVSTSAPTASEANRADIVAPEPSRDNPYKPVEESSDREVFDELSKIVESHMAASEPPQTSPAGASELTNEMDINADEVEPNEDQMSDNNDDNGGDEEVVNESPLKTKPIEKEVVVVTIESDDDGEQYVSDTTELVAQVKAENPDPTDDINVSDTSSQASVPLNTSNTFNESGSKSSTALAFSRHALKYTGFEDQDVVPAVDYSIGALKPTAVSSKFKDKNVVIALTTFKEYLLASYFDATVRRFHINDKQDVIQYDGHEGHVWAMVVVEGTATQWLYTGCNDKKLRLYDAMTARLHRQIELKDQILCLDYRFGQVFCGLINGTLCKVSAFHEMVSQVANPEADQELIKSFPVNANRRISAVVAVKVDIQSDCGLTNIEPVVVATSNKLRIIDTSDGVDTDEHRVLHSMTITLNPPVMLRVFGSQLFIVYKLPAIKSEDKTAGAAPKLLEKSKVLVYDMKKDWNPIQIIEMTGVVSAIDMRGRDVILCQKDGKVQCLSLVSRVGVENWSLKWIAYHLDNEGVPKKCTGLSACALVGSRLLLGTFEGSIDVVFIDPKPQDCDICGVAFARNMDLKHHIKLEHGVEGKAPGGSGHS